MPKLNWISEENLIAAVSSLLHIARGAKAKADVNFGKNVVDPFSAIFEMMGFQMSFDDWLLSEKSRQAQKSLQNFVGEFHQTILGSCHGWKDMGKGNIIDLFSEEGRVIAEIKNKFNTISGGKLADLYWSLEPAVMNKTSVYKGFTAYYVSIIPKTPERFNRPFTPSDNKKGHRCPENELIRCIDGASFYALVTGEENALEDLFSTLPDIIEEITGNTIQEQESIKKLFKLAYGHN